MKQRLITVAIVALLAVGGWWFWSNSNGGDANAALTLYGNVDIRDATLGFRVPGRIEQMLAEEGDSVAAGDLLATLDRGPLEQERALAAADLASAEANLDKLRRGFRSEEIEQAEALVNEREVALTNAERVFRRRAELLQTGAVPQEVYDEALAQRDSAAARLRTARENLRLLREGFRSEDIAAAEAAVTRANAALKRAAIAVADTELRAPADGVVLTRVREPGSVVPAGATVYTLALARPVWIRAYVDEPNLGQVYPGQRAEVYTDSRPDKPYIGQVGFVSPQAEFTPKNVETTELRTDLVYRLRVVIEEPDTGLRQGMPVTVRLDAGE